MDSSMGDLQKKSFNGSYMWAEWTDMDGFSYSLENELVNMFAKKKVPFI